MWIESLPFHLFTPKELRLSKGYKGHWAVSSISFTGSHSALQMLNSRSAKNSIWFLMPLISSTLHWLRAWTREQPSHYHEWWPTSIFTLQHLMSSSARFCWFTWKLNWHKQQLAEMVPVPPLKMILEGSDWQLYPCLHSSHRQISRRLCCSICSWL